jgi:hypothetical protein
MRHTPNRPSLSGADADYPAYCPPLHVPQYALQNSAKLYVGRSGGLTKDARLAAPFGSHIAAIAYLETLDAELRNLLTIVTL